MATGETQGQPATIRLPREVSRSLDLVVDLTDGRYQDRDGLVAEIVRDWLASAVQLGHEPTPRTRGTDGRSDLPARAGAPNETGPPGTDSERDARARAMHAL
jgi:Arc/MetJ-type ribon-helix-helix transcriptional regulator